MTGEIRQSNTEALKAKITPDALKSDSEVAQQGTNGALDNVAKHLPGQGKARDGLQSGATHDHGRNSLGDNIKAAVTPDSHKTVGDKVSEKVDHGASALTPESKKSVGQQITDTVTPSHQSSATKGDGVLASVTQAATDAKNAVLNTLAPKNEPAVEHRA